MNPEIVIGIDYGTTYSGASWAISGGRKIIRVVNDWPNPNSSHAFSEKVPSTISYQDAKPHHWGYSVDDREQSVNCVKLLLDSQIQSSPTWEHGPISRTLQQLEALKKSPDDVATDYLGKIWEHTKNDIRKTCGDNWENIHSVKAVITVPAIWSDYAKERTLRIAKSAGLPKDTSLINEPEAAAMAIVGEDMENDFQNGDCFIVCDAGGGTVDIVSYEVVGVNPLQVEECAVGDGGLCGSIYLDEGFERYIKTLVGEQQWAQLRPRSKDRMFREFELSIKRGYKGDEQNFSVDLAGVRDDAGAGIDDEIITLKPWTIGAIFDYVINQICRLIEGQVDEITKKGRRVKSILLAGGFGLNHYMHKRLYQAYGATGTRVLQTDRGWSATCRGATLWGLEQSTRNAYTKKIVKSRIARYSYGTRPGPSNQPFRPSWREREKSSNAEWRANHHIDWILRKGDRVEEGQYFDRSLALDLPLVTDDTGMYTFTTCLLYSNEYNPPLLPGPSVKSLCTVEHGIKHERLGLHRSMRGKWSVAQFDLRIHLDHASPRFSVKYNGEEVPQVDILYEEESTAGEILTKYKQFDSDRQEKRISSAKKISPVLTPSSETEDLGPSKSPSDPDPVPTPLNPPKQLQDTRPEPLETSQSADVALEVQTTLDDSAFAENLPLLVNKILSHFIFPIMEAAVPDGKTRVRWISGGKRMYEDYVELDPGAAADHEKMLQKRYGLSERRTTGEQAKPGLAHRILNVFRQQAADQQQQSSDSEQGEQDSQAKSNRLAPTASAGTSTSEKESPKQEFLRLLLCVDDGRTKQSTLKQELLKNINDDRDLFTHLRRQYFSKRSWFTLRSIGALSLAQFEVNYSNATNVYRHEHACGSSDELLGQPPGTYCSCIPPEERVGQDKEYRCDPAPKSRSIRRLVPVLGPKMLKGDFLNPKSIAAGQRTTFNQLPKRHWAFGDLRATPDSLAMGWGLHIEEDWHWPTIYFCLVITIVFSFVFGIVWSVLRHDVQGGFAVAGFIVTLGSMFLGLLALPKA